MIRHSVLTKFKPETDEDLIAALYAQLSALVDRLPGAHGFVGGRSESPEALEKGFMHGFFIDFDSWADLKLYAEHPGHLAIAARLIDSAIGGVDGVLVFDLAA
ncbi:Dabb family protein [Pararhodobacter zhoushanensis]|uniref:Dabb family protein n=1 Tax=Pararhodobacter zhoushanensis TaxID=2479545 RepID=A0ABT3GZR7_9RHOB|nr:Dabb family protein [Pararhodobacter zhoushanensis]MCW1933032.1 Dabb family protein [Pararhodobacter zhoushanensis]